MIPREILKEIRQIELRTNRIVTGFAAGARASARFTARTPAASKTNPARNSIRPLKRRERRAPAALFQPSPQFGGIAAAVKNGDDANEVRLYAEINFVFGENIHSRFASILGDQLKPFRVAQDVLKGDVNFGFKPVAQSGLLRFIPNDRLFKFEPRLRVENYLARHARPLIRSFNSARTCSHGIPLCGLRRNASPRRSNSASCSGVGSASNFSRSCSKTSRCSSNGSFSTCSMTCVALMALIYPVGRSAQLKIRQSPITIFP